MSDPFYLLQEAREFAKVKNLQEAEKSYTKAVHLLKKRLNGTNKSKMEYWSMESEYLFFKAGFIIKGEKAEKPRERALNAIRYMYKCVKLDKEYELRFLPDLQKMIKQTIFVFGCILPENATHFIIKCPILLRQTTLGKMGMSIGAIYKRAVCSICNLDILDEKCIHEVGKSYDEKICNIIKEGLEFLHIAVTNNPKDPLNRITEIQEPKKNLYDRFTPEELEKAKKEKSPWVCSSCKEMNMDPSEINVEQFFEMQGLKIDID